MTVTTFRRKYGSGHSYTLDGTPKIKGVTTMMKGLSGPPESYFCEYTAGHAVDNWERLAGMPPSARLKEIAGATKDRFTAAAALRWRRPRRTLASLLDLTTVQPGDERACAHCKFCQDLSEMGDPGQCACPRPCGRAWCTALRTATGTEGGHQ